MLTQENYTRENFERLYSISGNDPSLLEKTVYAFGLLEAIAKVGPIGRNIHGFQMGSGESVVTFAMKS